jgi:hypothetical protein
MRNIKILLLLLLLIIPIFKGCKKDEFVGVSPKAEEIHKIIQKERPDILITEIEIERALQSNAQTPIYDSIEEFEINKDFENNIERSSQLNLSQYLEGQYSIYRTQINGNNTYYFNVTTFTIFLSHYGLPSINVFDYNGNGVVDATDFNSTLSGFGNQYIADYNINDATIYLQASSGWGLELEGWNIIFLKTTPWDENPPGEFIPDNLKSFFLEGIRSNGDSVKIWYHKTN